MSVYGHNNYPTTNNRYNSTTNSNFHGLSPQAIKQVQLQQVASLRQRFDQARHQSIEQQQLQQVDMLGRQLLAQSQQQPKTREDLIKLVVQSQINTHLRVLSMMVMAELQKAFAAQHTRF